MTIRKGEAWGGAATAAQRNAPRVRSDAEAAAELWRQHLRGEEQPTVALIGGATWTLLGGASVASRIDTDEAMAFPIDVGVAELDGVEVPFVGHVVARTRWWRRGIAVMNGQSVGALRLGHRAHPNDGLLDLVTWELSFGDLWKVRRRAVLGAHTPHPRIAERRSATLDVEVPAGARLVVDDVARARGRVQRVRARVLADGGTVVL